jgi:superfamily II helicase
MSIYTDEVKRTWTCCLCSSQRKKGKGFVKRACKILAKDDKALTELAEQYLAIKTKVCRKCKTEKSVQEFGKDKATKDGLYYICKICTKGGK